MSKEDNMTFEEWTEMKIPKFRKTTRLIKWLREEGPNQRLPASYEEIFFTSKEDPSIIAENLSVYVRYAGKLEPRFEELLKKNKQHLYEYIQVIYNSSGEKLNHLVEELKSEDSLLYRWATQTGRLPEHLENSLTDPKVAYAYAKHVLCGRLPEHLEELFFKDVHYACKYAFEIIRGFASVKLPEKLHSYVIMKSFERPDDSIIKNYMQASESDPDKIGNFSKSYY